MDSAHDLKMLQSADGWVKLNLGVPLSAGGDLGDGIPDALVTGLSQPRLMDCSRR